MTCLRIEHKQFIDKNTGEIVEQEFKKIFTCKYHSDKFYRVYFDWAPFGISLTAQAKDLLNYMCMKAEYNTGKISLSTSDRNDLCDAIHISSSRLSQLIKELTSIGALSGSKGTYYINPQMFWIGDSLARDEMLKNGDIEFTISLKPDSEVYKNFLEENNLEEIKAD